MSVHLHDRKVAKFLNHILVDTDDGIVKESDVLLQLEESSTEQAMSLNVPDDNLVEETHTCDATEDVSTTQSEFICTYLLNLRYADITSYKAHAYIHNLISDIRNMYAQIFNTQITMFSVVGSADSTGTHAYCMCTCRNSVLSIVFL